VPEPGKAAPAAGGGEASLITFRAREISLFDALKIVTDVANLKHRIDGSVVMVVPADEPEGVLVLRKYDVLPTVKEKITKLYAELARPSAAAAPAGGGAFPGLGAEPAAGAADQQSDWKGFFGTMGVNWPKGSSIQYLPTAGKLVVKNTVDNLATFEEVLTILNVVPNQIEIEARFVEIKQTDLSSLGFEWLLTDNFEMAQNRNTMNRSLGARERIDMQAGSFTRGNRFLTERGLGGDATTTAADNLLTIASVLTNPELSFILHVLQQSGHADLLSAPKVMTQPNVQATIKVVTEYIYPTEFTVTGLQSAFGNNLQVTSGAVVEPGGFETREVGVILSVLADVSPETQLINLTMTPEVVTDPLWHNYGSIYTDANGREVRLNMEQPFFHTRSISTSILIQNEATVVMGGMITERRDTIDDRVPFLGDIPLVGRLFRSKAENSEKRNLLIFVTARLFGADGRPIGTQTKLPTIAAKAE
jgi:general secretion pathway protein D